MDNVALSLGQLCGSLESGSGAGAIECCVNENNLKLVCTQVIWADTLKYNIEHNQNGGSVGYCDTRASNIPPTKNVCS